MKNQILYMYTELKKDTNSIQLSYGHVRAVVLLPCRFQKKCCTTTT